MTGRWIAAAAALTVLLALLAWQHQRMALVEACHAAGGWWDGNRSRCRQIPPSIIIEKNLKRSAPTLDAPGAIIFSRSARLHEHRAVSTLSGPPPAAT